MSERTIALPRWIIPVGLVVALLAVAVTAWRPAVSLPGWAAGKGGEAPEVVAAEKAIAAILMTEYRNRAEWEKRVRSLCSESGWQFWRAQPQRGMWDTIPAKSFVTEKVQVESAQLLQTGGGQATVAVKVTVISQSKDGKRAESFDYKVVMEKVGDRWLFSGFAFSLPKP